MTSPQTEMFAKDFVNNSIKLIVTLDNLAASLKYDHEELALGKDQFRNELFELRHLIQNCEEAKLKLDAIRIALLDQ